MFIFLTELVTEDGRTWSGDRIEAISYEHAEYILETTGRGYMNVIGVLNKIETEDGEIIDYEMIMSN